MPYLVNGQPVPEELIRVEFGRIGRDPNWQSIPDVTERAKRLRAAAEQSAQDRILIEQIAAGDPRGSHLLGTMPRLIAPGRDTGCPPKPSGSAPRAAASTNKTYPGGDDLTLEGSHLFDLGEDSFTAPEPVDSFQPNGFGLYNAVRERLEWCADYFDPVWHVEAAGSIRSVRHPERHS